MAEAKMLIMFDTKANSNKFYEMIMDDSGQINVRFGRVGGGAQTTSYSGGKKKFDSLLASKIKKGYREAQLEVVSGAEGMTQKVNILDIALKQIHCVDDSSRKLVESIAKENIHNITSNSNIKFDEKDGLFKTPLGVVKKIAVEEAMTLLDSIEAMLKTTNYDEDKVLSLNEDYFMLIPNKVSNARDKRDLLFTQKNIDAQREVCKALIDTLDLIQDLKDRKEATQEVQQEMEKVFDVTIEELNDVKILSEIMMYYDKSKNSMHGQQIMKSKVSRVFKVALGSQQAPFEAMSKEIGNVELLWHGTRVANMLSILGKGLLMPNASPGAKAGAMFGLGTYFANQSSKSLQYSDGMYWASGSQKRNKIYMFLASVAMGNYEVPKGPTGPSGKPSKGYDSFWAKSGVSGVRNDEIIVFNLSQVRLDYIVEIEI